MSFYNIRQISDKKLRNFWYIIFFFNFLIRVHGLSESKTTKKDEIFGDTFDSGRMNF